MKKSFSVGALIGVAVAAIVVGFLIIPKVIAAFKAKAATK